MIIWRHRFGNVTSYITDFRPKGLLILTLWLMHEQTPKEDEK